MKTCTPSYGFILLNQKCLPAEECKRQGYKGKTWTGWWTYLEEQMWETFLTLLLQEVERWVSGLKHSLKSIGHFYMTDTKKIFISV